MMFVDVCMKDAEELRTPARMAHVRQVERRVRVI